MANDTSRLTLAVRAYPRPIGKTPHRPARQTWTTPESLLILDTETRIDAMTCRSSSDRRLLENGTFRRG